MKLIGKYILINTLLSVCILLTGELSLYYLLTQNVKKEITEHLNLERLFLIKKIQKGVDVLSFRNNIGDVITVTEIPSIKYTQPFIENIQVGEEWEEEEFFSSQKITFDITQNKKNYRVSIVKTIDEDEGLSHSIWVIMIISGLTILLVLTIVNIIIQKKIFAPIYQLNRDINLFSVKHLNKITPPKTSTKEFQHLGESISLMSEKIINDYKAMKEFTENIAHEIQTPLAVISVKIEQCLQHQSLNEGQAHLLNDALQKVNKLFSISKGLSLLGKLDNEQFTSKQCLDLFLTVQQRLDFFNDFIESKKITITKKFLSNIYLEADASLLEILIDNLIKNAIKHNFESGQIIITINNQQLIFSNTGEQPTENTSNYFKRFYSKKTDSLGLGLSIIKKIVEYYNYSILYNFNNGFHTVTINFK